MIEQHKSKKELKPKKVIYFTGTLSCQRCAREWSVVDLNPERKAVKCPVCSFSNDIREAIKGAL